MSSLMKLTSSASFSPSIRISLRLKIHQAQAKNFCRVLDIRVCKAMEDMRKQTLEEGMRAVALRMLELGKNSLDEISIVSGLSLDEVKKLNEDKSA